MVFKINFFYWSDSVPFVVTESWIKKLLNAYDFSQVLERPVEIVDVELMHNNPTDPDYIPF